MKVYCGTDIIEIERIKSAIEETSGFAERIYTQYEIDYCKRKKGEMYKSFAVRFSAKEAVAKALGTGFNGKVRPVDIEILNDEYNKPYVKLHGNIKTAFERLNINHMDLSLSHCNNYAVAYFVAITDRGVLDE